MNYTYANNTDLIITNYTTNESSIHEGDTFELTLDITNNSGYTVTDLYLIIDDNTSFYPNATGSKKLITDSLASGVTESVTVDLVYDGGNNKLPITMTYKVGLDNYEISDVIGISAVKTSDTQTPSAPRDTSKYVPRIIIDSFTNTPGDAGKLMDVTLTFKNNSSHQAKNIIITPIIDDVANQPFVYENQKSKKIITEIKSNKTEKVTFSFRIKDSAVPDSYPIKFKIDYVNTFGDVFETTETLYFKVRNTNTPPRFSVESIITQPKAIEAGSDAFLFIKLKNEGSLTAKNLTVTLEGLDTNGFTVLNGTNTSYKREINGLAEETFVYNLHASPQLGNGNHSLTLNVSYKDQENKAYDEDFTFFIPVGGETSGSGDIKIANIKGPTEEVEVNEDFTLQFDISNVGTGPVTNVKVMVDGGTSFLPKSQNLQVLNKMEEATTENMDFSFYTSFDAKTQSHPILIEIEYDTLEKGVTVKKKITQYYGVFVNNPDPNKKSTPKIIIDKYSFEPGIVRAGETFDLTVSFMNTNKEKSVENIKIYLTVNESTDESGSVFTPVNSSNTFFIDYISPKSSHEKKVTLYTIPDADPKTYTITANFEYQDQEGNEYTATELIGIPVVQQTRLEVNDIVLPPEQPMGYPLPIFLEFYNMGKTTINNLVVKLEGNFTSQNGTYFVGNFEAGSNEYFEAMIIPNEVGLLEGNVVFSYEDSAGEAMELRKPISLNITEMQMEFPGEGGEFPMEPPQESFGKKLLKSKIFWAFITLAVATVGFIIWRKIKKRKGMEADEVY